MQDSCQFLGTTDSGKVSTTANFDDIVQDKATTLHIFGKNVQSLQTEARTDELIEELQVLEWDVVFLNETWREEAQERWRTTEGHMFFGSGGKKGEKGTGLVLHRRWTHGFRKFRAISERICCVDVNIAGQRFRFISVYMPHAGCDDTEVDSVYTHLSELVSQGERNHRKCVVNGDFNAVVGPKQTGDDDDVIGEYGVGSRNLRGEWLLHWATCHQLAIVNTMFPKHFEDQWTHQRGDVKRQIDYCLISGGSASIVTDANSCDDVNVGIDHRAVKVLIEIRSRQLTAKSNAKPTQMRCWAPRDKAEYQKRVDERRDDAISRGKMTDAESKCNEMEKILVEVGKHCATKSTKQHYPKASPKLQTLIEERKKAKRENNKMRVKETSKEIQKEIKAAKRKAKTEGVTKVLEEYKDLQRLAAIRCEGKVKFITSVIDQHGVEQYDRIDIANVFADFFETLYSDAEQKFTQDEAVEEMPEVTIEEIKKQLKHLKRRKCADDAGVVAELLKDSSQETLKTIAEIFTEVMKPGAKVPEYWKKSSIRVLFKKGDSKSPENYRPICIIPILYKLFSKVLAGRIKEILNSQQSPDQAGFRPDFSCDDNLFAITMLIEKSREFNCPLWVAALDFKKAFDSIHHDSIFESLAEQKVPATYVDLLIRLYEGQSAKVLNEEASREFRILKGTKQGDPISSLLFNAVLEQVMRKVKEKWKARGYGIQLECSVGLALTNLRFADDILLTARSLPQIKQMLIDVVEASAEVGLTLHPEKTKIQHNNIGYGSRVKKAVIKGMEVEVLPPEGFTMYLGRALNLTDVHEVELKNRVKKAWAKFSIFTGELTDQKVSLRLRMKLFDAVVTPSILYGSSSWAVTDSRQKLLRTTQTKMVRCILRAPRKVSDLGQLEAWPEWVQRATHQARAKMQAYGIQDWALIQQARKISWHSKVKNMENDRWAKKVLQWEPKGLRSQGRPRTRWTSASVA